MVVPRPPIFYPRSVSWVDLVIALVAVSACFRGRREGALRQVGRFAGFVGGFMLGTVLAPRVSSGVTHSAWRPVLAIALVVMGASLGASLGRAVGSLANTSLRHVKLGSFDQAAGAAVGLVGALVGCWLLAGLVVNSSWGLVTGPINHSKILAVVDSALPPIPSVEARVTALFHQADFPSVLAEVVAPVVTPVPAATSSQAAAAIAQHASAVQRVQASGNCAADHEGTSFVVGPSLVVTAAHVLAGATHVTVGGRAARVVVFDPTQDVAILRVSTSGWSIIPIAPSPPAIRAAGAVVGYPLNGPYRVTPAAVAGVVSARTRDIYNSVVVTRSMLVLTASVQSGNSGSPIMIAGDAVGMVFAKLPTGDVAYGVTASTLSGELAASTRATGAATGACLAS